MPTPFMHLVIADSLIADPGLPDSLRATFQAHRPAFRLGHIAPDAQTMSGQTREATHFFRVPMTDTRPAHETMFACHPELARPRELAPDRAAFLTGYLCHLVLDQLWIRDIFQPVFGEKAEWGTFRERLYLHNVLRTYLDQLDLPRLSNGVGDSLRAATPAGWLPFLDDGALACWREMIADQLAPGAAARTVEVFAGRMKLDPAEFRALLDSPAELDRRIFVRLPLARLEAFRAEGLALSLQLTCDYWRN